MTFLALLARALTRLGHRILFALAFGVDTVGIDTLADHVGLDRRGAPLGQLLVVGIGTKVVGMTNGNDHFKLDRLGLGNHFVQLLLAFRTQRRLVEVEQRVGGDGDLVTRGLAPGKAAPLGLAARRLPSAADPCRTCSQPGRWRQRPGSRNRCASRGRRRSLRLHRVGRSRTHDSKESKSVPERARRRRRSGGGEQGHHGVFCSSVHLGFPR
jgi:hypothetical protein